MYQTKPVELTLFRIKEAETPTITCSQEFVDNCKDIADLAQEAVHVLTLNNKNRVLSRHMVSLGTVNQSIVHPRDVYRAAIVDGASKICLIHNHPSGDYDPSAEDIQITRRIKQAGELLGIPLLDHIIIAREGHYSFQESGLLEDI